MLRLINSHAGLLKSRAYRAVKSKKLEFEDAHQSATEGFIRGVYAFNVSSGFALSTCVHGHISSALNVVAKGNAGMGRVAGPQVPQTTINRYSAVMRAAGWQYGQALSLVRDEDWGITEESFISAHEALNFVKSLSTPVSDSDGYETELSDLVEAPNSAGTPEPDYETRFAVIAALAGLRDRDAAVLAGYYGIDGPAYAPKELSDIYGMKVRSVTDLIRRATRRAQKSAARGS